MLKCPHSVNRYLKGSCSCPFPLSVMHTQSRGTRENRGEGVCNLCVSFSTVAFYSVLPCCVSKPLHFLLVFSLALSLPSSVLHQCSCKHQCRQLLKALPFDLASVSCVGGQIAAVSHTQYLTQSPELWTHPPPPLCSVAPLTMHVSPPFMASSVLSAKVNSTFTAQRSLPQERQQ